MTNPTASTASSGPLDGVRVLDLTTVFMGPSCTQLLADLGADVIKIESPGGDSTRSIGPSGELGLGPLFLGLNRNKRSVVIDLKKSEGVAALLRMAKDADVFTTNVRPAAMRRLGVGYEQLSAVNPRLIYASMVGFSQRGPYAGKAAFDDMIQAATGLPAVVAESSGDVPRYLPITIADRSVGLYAFGVICAALHARNSTGVGQSVDIPMFETMIPYVLGDHLYGRTFVPGKGDFGYPRLMSKNRRPYKTKDGYVCCLIYTDRHWSLFLEAVGKGDLIKTDPRFRDIGSRTRVIDELYQLVSDELEKRTTAEWKQLLPENEIPIFPMHTFDTLLEDEHLASTGFFQQTEHPVVGKILETAVPSEWSGTPPTRHLPVPSLGEHTVEVLDELGFSSGEIETLLASGAVRANALTSASKKETDPS
ncbi:CaiB/BaiF CoA transferase family protein [Ottowia thiooxydans]|uniref:CaiB/BaiF CoA transferase family protein n=1 Tax=Ottowia thiooxydans TaxID=219182 RepID=UPI0003FDECD9|nr:CoA transferase [Ottowia thiooxydans]